MKTKLRKLLALLMTLAMFISSVPTTALAAVVPYSGGTDTGSGISLRSIVKPPVATTTYVFMNGTEEFARQILKNGQTLNNPGTPDAGSPNKEFTGWRDGDNNAPTFGAVTVTETKTITYHAQFADVYFVFFTNEKGEVMVTKKGANGDKISTEGVTYPVDNEQSIVGWKDASGNLVSSVTLNGRDVTLTAKVENGHWITYDSQGGTYVAPAFVKGNGTTTAPAAPTRPGYTFRHWSATVGGAAFNFGNALTTALTLYAVWTPNTRTQYTVIHWQENADDDEYSYAESETKYGTTGAQTSAAAKSYTGFTAQTIAQQTIAGDGSTIVNVYYKRNVYEVKFYEYKSSGFYGGSWEEITNLKITAKYQAFIGDKWPTYDGSSTWSTNSSLRYGELQGPYQVNIETMPLNGAKFYGPKTGSSSESAHYYVEVLPGESGVTTIDSVTYKLHHTDTSPGTGYTVTVEDQYPITGFTFNEDISTKIEGKYNNAKFYYTRNSYNIVYVSGGQTVNTASKKFEQSIADAGSYTPTVKPAGMEDYDFGGWHADPAGEQAYTFTGKTMPAQNVTVYAKWNKPVYNGTIYLTIEGTGSSFTLSVPKGNTIETALNEKQAEIMAQVGEGYTWRGWRTGKDGTGEPFNPQTRITTDVTLYPYYTKDGTFTVEYVSGKNNVTAPVDGKSYAEDSFADLMSPGKLVADDGEYFLGWSDGAATYQPRDKYQIKSNHADERNVITLTAQWGARPAGTTLTYKANGGTGEDEVKNLANNETVTTIANPFSRVGYTFKGWDTDPKGEGSIAPNTQVQVDNNGGENVLYAIWTANTDTKYTVEFYYQNTDGSYPQKANESVVRNDGTTDTTVSVKDSDKLPQDGGKYVFDESNANNVLSGVVAGDGSLVLKLYFKLNTASYTIHHYLNGTTVKVAKDQTGAKTIGEELTANKSDALYAAYAAAEVARYAPSQTITIAADESKNVITVYYTMPLTIKAKDASKTYDGQPLTQPDFTVEGLVNGDTKENFTLSMTAESTITNAGSTPNVIDESTVKYNGGAIPSYYNVSYAPGTLTVNKASATVTITGVNKTHVYDGKQHEANGYNYSFTGKPNEITISLKPNVLAIAKRTDVGTTTMGLTKDSFTVTSANYDVTITAVNDGYVTITPVTDKVTVTVTENGAIVTYDGNEHSVKGYKSMTADNKLYDVTKSVKATETAAWTAKGTNAGEYPVGIAAGDFKNTNPNFENVAFKIVDGVLKINPITENTITITANSKDKTYDGTPLTDGGFTFTEGVLVKGDVLTAVVEGSATNVGDEGRNVVKSYVVKRGETDVTNNYTFGESIIGTLTVTPVAIELTAASASKAYDGTPLTNSNYTITKGAFVDEEGLAAVTIAGSQTLVGASANTITGHTLKDNTLAQNYTITYQPGELKVTQNEKAITITANSHTWEYNGQPHSDGGYTVNYDGVDYPVAAGEFATLPTGDKVTATVEGSVTNVADSADDNNVVTNVTITNEAGAVVNDQYKTITRVNGGLKITRRGDSEDEDKKVKIIAELNTVEYDGKAHGANLNAKGEIELGTSYTTARLVDGHYVDETTLDITGSQTNVGVYEEELKPAVKAGATRIVIRDKDDNDVTDNYALTLVNATLTITGDKLIPDKKAEDENIESNYKLGDKIEFTITVKNVSIYDVENVIVTDASAEIQAGDGYTVSADKHTATIASIAAKSEIRIKALHTVTSEDILAGKVGNVANVEWKDGEKTVTKTVDDDTTKLTPPDVTLNVTKTSDWEGSNDKKVPPEVGTKITYTITVTNTGNVPATNVRFKDVLQENKATVTGDIPTYGTLGVGEENKESFTVEYIVTEADLLKGSILNEVFANADEINYTYYVEEDGKEVAKPGTKTVKEAEAFVEDTTVQASASFTSTKTTTSTPKNEKGYALGETITYEIKVTNDGNLTLTDVEVTEKLAGAVIKASSDYTVSGSVATIAELKPGQTVIVNVEYVVTEADILAGSVKNEATVKGNGPDGKDPDPKEPGTEDPTDKPKATLNIAKSVVSTPKNGTSYKLGETITYKLTVKVGADNNLTVKNIKVTDTLLTAENVNAKIVEIAGGYTLNENNEIELPDMAPGATEVVITYTYTVQESDLGSGAYGSVYNAATTKGITPDGQEPKKDTETNTPTNIRLIITAKPNTGIEYDGDAHGENGYDATGLATGHEITSVTISGSRTNVGYYPEELDPSDAVIMEGNVDVTSHYEITYVKGDLEIIKRGLDEKNPVQIIAKSNTVGYNGKAHGAKLNAKGEIELGTSYTTTRLVEGHYVDETTLDITGSQTNVGVYEEELKPAVKAGATRIVIRDKDDNDVTDNYALTLVNATLTITGDKLIPDKKAEDENIESNYKLGDKIEFTITVKNVSIYDVENVIVTDASAEIQAGDGYTVSADKHTATIASIAAKSEIRIKALHTVTSEDILAGKVGNVANVEWKDGEKTVTKTVDDDTTKLTPPDVTLNVTKTSDWEGSNDKKVPPEVGTKITYTITVTNTGNVPATNVRFKDVLQENKATVTGDIPTYGTLGVGEENKESFTVEYIVTEADLLKGSILNEVFANADEINYTYYVEEDGKEVAKPGTKTVKEAEAFVEDTTVQASASFTSTKTTTSTPKNEKGYALGETITYEIKVTNDGNLTLTDVEVTEKLAGAVIKASSDYTVSGSVATIAELKPGQTVIVNVEYVVTEADILAGSVKNEATVKGNGPDGKDPDPKEPGTEDPTDKPKATLNIAKDVVESEESPKNGKSYALGEKITYKLTVKVGADNNVTVKDVRVTDTLLTAENVNAKIVEIAGGYTLNATGEIELPDMAPGAADVVITYTYTVQESDLGSGAYGSVHNAAVSKGATPDPDPENPNPKPDDPKDEDKKDTPTNIRLVITANNNTGIVYDGEEHGEDGYKQTGLSKDHTIEKVTISGKRTNVGEEKLVPSDAKIVDKAGNDVTSHYDIEYVNATLEIIQKKLTITADSDEKFYDETPLTKDSYTNTELAKGDKIANVTITGTITEVGSVENVASGAKIVNAAGEDVTGNYDIEYVKGTLTIKAIPADGFVDVTITKKWDDANNQDGKRDDVTLTLNASANGRLIDWDVLKDIAKNGANLTMDETAEHVFARAEFTDDKDSYSYTFRNVPKYANFNDVNTLIDFAVTENEVPDFYEIDVENSTRLMIVNVHEVKTMNIHVTKVWDDEDNNDGYRPDAITVKLYADGALYGEKTITPDENDVWETTFENLPVYKKGETISYTVEEDAIDEYTTTYSTEKPIVGGDYDEVAREVTITNRYEIKKMNIKVIKIWADSDNEDKLRPNALSFDLYKTVGGGERELVLQFQLRSSTGTSVWKYKDLRTTIGGLNVYENGEKIHYSIEETTVIEGYTVKYIDNDIVGGNKVNDQYQTDFMTWVTNYHIIKRPNRLIGPMGMTSGECVE